MDATKALSGLSLAVALAAFGVTGALALRAQVEPFYAVLRSMAAFIGVLCLARWSASAVDALGLPGGRQDGSSGGPPDRDGGGHD